MQLKVLENRLETKDCCSLILEKPDQFSFYPGQYLDIELPVNDPLGTTRIFSLSSSPSENFVMMTVKKTTSPFNKKLQKLKPGETISSSHPAGTVVIDDSSPAILMAGGVGIAPHRSIIKWLVDQKKDLPITLIYSNSDEDFIFKKELEQWAKEYPSLKIHFVVTSIDGRLTEEKLKKILPNNSELIYYLAGPPKMVDDFENILLSLGIDETSIRTDRFDGL